MARIIAYLYIETILLSIFTIWFLCRVKKRWIRWEKIVPDMREFVKRNEKRINMILKGIVASFLILSFVDVVIPAVQDFPIVMSENYLEVEGIVTEWNYSDEEKSEIRVIGIMDNKTNKEIFVTVYSKGIHKGEYLKVKYLPHSKYGEIEENE